MSNVRTISQEDLDKYPSLKGRQVGDEITAEEDAKLRASENKPAKVEEAEVPGEKPKKN